MAQRHLFRSLVVVVRRYQKLYGMTPHIRSGEYFLQRFLDFLNHSPHLADFVRNIRIEGTRGHLPLLGGFIQEVLCKARSLLTVTLVSMTLDPGIVPEIILARQTSCHDIVSATSLPKPPVQDDVDRSPPHASIDALNLLWCRFARTEAFLDVLRSFTRIRHLNIYDCGEASGDAEQHGFNIPPSTVPVIESVTAEYVYLLTLLRSALCASSLSGGALRSIRLAVTGSVDIDHLLLPCLRYAHNHIRALYLDVALFGRRMLAEEWREYSHTTSSQIIVH